MIGFSPKPQYQSRSKYCTESSIDCCADSIIETMPVTQSSGQVRSWASNGPWWYSMGVSSPSCHGSSMAQSKVGACQDE